MDIRIIAEIAQGYEGKAELAHLLMNAAANAGADAVKYQLVYADELATPDYQYYNLFKSLEMDDSTWIDLFRYSSELGIELIFDIFGEQSLKLSEKIGIKTIKLHATDITNIGLLTDISKSKVENVLIGVGGAYLNEILHAIQAIKEKKITILLGFQGYPTPTSANQIDRIRLLREHSAFVRPNINFGFSDHEIGTDLLRFAVPSIAIGAGAVIIEKHITLGKVMKLEDHESALNPDEFAEFVKTIKACAQAMGYPNNENNFGMSESETNYRKVIRRQVVTKSQFQKDYCLTSDDVVLKRTSIEEACYDITQVYNRKLKKDISENTPITRDMLY